MEALILVGGTGTRLHPLTHEVPKPLLPVGNLPMLVRLIEGLPAEFDTVVLAVGYKATHLTQYFHANPVGRRVVIVEESEPLGTGGGFANCKDHVTGTFAGFNGDVLSSLDLAAMLEFHQKHGGIGTLALWEVEDPTRYGVVTLDRERKVTRFLEKPGLDQVEPPYLINAGTYLLEPEIFDIIPGGRKVSIEREVYPECTTRGLHGYPFSGFWVDAGTPMSFLAANFAVLGKEQTKSYPGCDIIPPALIHPTATLKGCRLGPNVVVGADAHLWGCEATQSIIMEGVQGLGADLRDCIVGPGVKLEGEYRREVVAGQTRIGF